MARLTSIKGTVAGLGLAWLGALFAVKWREDDFVEDMWRTLEGMESPGGVFTEEMVAGLPDPARRYFLHSIEPGTPLASRLHWRYSGSLRTGRNAPWMSLSAEQVIVKHRGFVWKARVRKGPVLLTGADHYLDGDSRMRIALFGLIPVVNAAGPDISRSALGRVLIEGVFMPSTLLPGPSVEIEGVDDSRFQVTVSLQGESVPMVITVDESGRPTEMVMQRWGNVTEDGTFGHIPYGSFLEEEGFFGGYTIPTRARVGWWFGTDRYLEVIRLEVERAELS